ncbi:hypothetical protein [Microtetraspora niveoalba]|uniref:hypothetical protein n=1 Tax=Microtetraspora niveoalba TaxID=46175 RepID=UPI0008317D13|nr:hypothetical protein [Microtetraspora niveoalba]
MSAAPPRRSAHPEHGDPRGGRLLLSLAWASLAFLTFGVAVPFLLAHAAYRLRSRAQAIAAAVHCAVWALVLTFRATLAGVPTADWRWSVVAAVWLFGLWAGGTIHVMALRDNVFRR